MQTISKRPKRASYQAEWTFCEALGEYADNLEAERDALKARERELVEVLEWYREHCDALSRFTIARQTDAMMACITALSLDAGTRARAALAKPEYPTREGDWS